jgi:hypothetical protein
MPRLVCLAALLAMLLAGCGDDAETVIETQTQTGAVDTTTSATAPEAGSPTAKAASVPSGDHGPRYFETPSHNIGCYVSRQNRAEVVCAGDTTLGGPAVLAYGRSARRGSIFCISRLAGITCRNAANGHGFFLSRARYRIF